MRENNAQESRSEKKIPVDFSSSREKHRKSRDPQEKRDRNANFSFCFLFIRSCKFHKQIVQFKPFLRLLEIQFPTLSEAVSAVCEQKNPIQESSAIRRETQIS